MEREELEMIPQSQPVVISASRRTDIPNYYASWFLQRLREGFVLVRNVRDYHQVRRVDLAPDALACIVFWTKNFKPMMEYVPYLERYSFYIHYAITAYGDDVEPRVPPIGESIDCLRRIADRIGPERIIWRYDPIFMNRTYPLGHHVELFSHMASRLKGYTKRCVFSFLDHYGHIRDRMGTLEVEPLEDTTAHSIAAHIVTQCNTNGMATQTCAENFDFDYLGISHGACIDSQLIERISGLALGGKRDKNQRPDCRCAPSVDIGTYNTCLNLCRYCYANHNEKLVHANYAKARSTSEFLVGGGEEGDTLQDMSPVDKRQQLSLFGLDRK